VSASPRSWIAVASAEHVQRGRNAGFMQVCHGKVSPLRRVRPDDHVIYYSPTHTFGGRDKLQAFTAIASSAVVTSTSPIWDLASSHFAATSLGSPHSRRRSHRCSISSN